LHGRESSQRAHRILLRVLPREDADEFARARGHGAPGGIDGVDGAIERDEIVEDALQPTLPYVVGREIHGQIGDAEPGERRVAETGRVVDLERAANAEAHGLAGFVFDLPGDGGSVGAEDDAVVPLEVLGVPGSTALPEIRRARAE